jgi:hypothetical protein
MALQEITIVANTAFMDRQPAASVSRQAVLNLSEPSWRDASTRGNIALEAVPHLFGNHSFYQEDNLLQLRKSTHTIQIELGEDTPHIDFRASIDPLFFMELLECN